MLASKKKNMMSPIFSLGLVILLLVDDNNSQSHHIPFDLKVKSPGCL